MGKAHATKGKGAEATEKPTLLAGSNPQIAKADGDAPVQAYIAAMPDWKSDIEDSHDTLIVRTVPGVRKAIKWSSPFYSVEGRGWFMSVPNLQPLCQGHLLPRHVSVTRAHRRPCSGHRIIWGIYF